MESSISNYVDAGITHGDGGQYTPQLTRNLIAHTLATPTNIDGPGG